MLTMMAMAYFGCQIFGAPTDSVVAAGTMDLSHAYYPVSTIRVSGGGDALQKAIEKAKDGDVLLVEAGDYTAIDTQGKEIVIQSESGPERTFISCGRISKPWGLSTHAALLMSDRDVMSWIDDEDDELLWPEYMPQGVEWVDWSPLDVKCSTLVGFSFKKGSYGSPTGQFIVNGGKLVNCIFKDMDEEHGVRGCGYLHAAEAINCLFVAKTMDGEMVCDCSIKNWLFVHKCGWTVAA